MASPVDTSDCFRNDQSQSTAASPPLIQQPRKLLDLPGEILDKIFRHVIDTTEQDASSIAYLKATFLTPMAQVSQTTRRRILRILLTETLWISIKTTDRFGLKLLKDARKVFFRNGPESAPPLVPIMPNVFGLQNISDMTRLEINVRLQPPADLRISVQPQTVTCVTTMLFPFSIDAYARICQLLRGYIEGDLNVGMHFRYIGSHQSCLTRPLSRALSITLTLTGLTDVTFKVPHAARPSESDVTRMVMPDGAITDLLDHAKQLLDLANKWEAEGRYTDAGLILLYSQWIAKRAQLFLPMVKHWHFSHLYDSSITERLPYHTANELFLNNRYHGPEGRNSIGNNLRSAVHEIEYRACLSFHEMCRINGPVWIHSHIWAFMVDMRWEYISGWSSFGLSTYELSEYHYARGITVYFTVYWQVYRAVVESPFDDELWSCFQAGFIKPITEALHHVALAVWLKPTNKMFKATLGRFMMSLSRDIWLSSNPQRFRDTVKKLMSSIAHAQHFADVAVPTEQDVIEYARQIGLREGCEFVRDTTIASWKGGSRMFLSWPRNSLQFLPQARKGLPWYD